MKQALFSSGGNAPRVVDVHVVALYEPKTGRVAHVHTVTVFEGGQTVNEKEAIEAARRHAAKAGHRTELLEVKVSNNPLHGRIPHRIDLQTGEFIALAVQLRRQQ